MVLLKLLIIAFISFPVLSSPNLLSSRYGPYFRFRSRLSFDPHHPWRYAPYRFSHYPDFYDYSYNSHMKLPSLQSPITTKPITANKEYGDQIPSKSGEVIPNTFILSDDAVSWDTALATCLSKGMILASPQSTHEMHEIEAYLRKNNLLPIDAYSGYWLGARLDSNTNNYIWAFNRKEVEFQMWMTGKPRKLPDEDCSELKKKDYEPMKLSNSCCTENKRYICEELTTEESLKNKNISHVVDKTIQTPHLETQKTAIDSTGDKSLIEASSVATTDTTKTSINRTKDGLTDEPISSLEQVTSEIFPNIGLHNDTSHTHRMNQSIINPLLSELASTGV